MARRSISQPAAVAEAMRDQGRVIVETRTSEGQSYGLDNGVAVSTAAVRKLQGDLFVKPSEDGLFPGHSQTWRIEA